MNSWQEQQRAQLPSLTWIGRWLDHTTLTKQLLIPWRKGVLPGSVEDPWDPHSTVTHKQLPLSVSRSSMRSQVTPIPNANRESPCWVSEPPSPKEKGHKPTSINSVSTAIPSPEYTHHPLPHISSSLKPHQECASDSFATLALYKFTYLLTYLLSHPRPHHQLSTKSTHSSKQLLTGIHVTPVNLRDPFNTK